MQLAHIPLTNLSVSAANMRDSRKAPDISDILPSVRARGALVPLLVRLNGSPEILEIVARRRRFHAAKALGGDRGGAEPSAFPPGSYTACGGVRQVADHARVAALIAAPITA